MFLFSQSFMIVDFMNVFFPIANSFLTFRLRSKKYKPDLFVRILQAHLGDTVDSVPDHCNEEYIEIK